MTAAAAPRTWPRVVLGGTVVDLLTEREAVELVAGHAASRGGPALAVVSANLDHVHRFGAGGTWTGTIGLPGLADPAAADADLAWLSLLDGAPLASRAHRLTGRLWPRLAGSDIVGPILDRAAADGVRVGFLGGSRGTHEVLRSSLARRRPELVVTGYWAPERAELRDANRSARFAWEVRTAGVDLLVVGLGKPRQELWIAEHGAATGARVLLAFGAVVDFLANKVRRAPSWASRIGAEWAWRLMLEPRRLARRYLVDGPEAYLALRRHSTATVPAPPAVTSPSWPPAPAGTHRPGRLVTGKEPVDVAVLVVTYNNADDVGLLLADLRAQATDLRLRVVVVDNASSDGTYDVLLGHDDVVAIDAGDNLGYAGGINLARAAAGKADALLVLNPDLRLRPGAIAAMLDRLRRPGVGVVAPRLLERDGTTYCSLRREPSLARAVGDLLGDRAVARPRWLSETDRYAESYEYAHPVDWATGVALLVSAAVDGAVGRWDERFFLYSEETDFCHRVRATGAHVWYEPRAVMAHERGGSGRSPALTALLTVNRFRYAAAHHSRPYAWAFGGVVAVHSMLRLHDPGHRAALGALVSPRARGRLPGGDRAKGASPATPALAIQLVAAAGNGLVGAIVMPAHNEERIIARTLEPLAALAADGTVEIVVVANGCRDRTADVARNVPGVRVLEFGKASKPGALNTGDAAATAWPRLYVDADVTLTPKAVLETLSALADGRWLAARPRASYDLSGASRPVRSFYRARARMPSLHHNLWGAGVYGLSAAGHERLGAFPDLTADDLWVDQLFAPDEKYIVDTDPVRVRAPRDVRGLLAVVRRTARGSAQVHDVGLPSSEPSTGASTGRTVRELARTVHGLSSALDAAVYASFAVAGHLPRRRRPGTAWERDESSRR